MSRPKQAIAWAAVSSALYLLFRIWREVRREGTETIVVLDRVGDGDEPDYSQWSGQPSLLNGRGGHDHNPLAN